MNVPMNTQLGGGNEENIEQQTVVISTVRYSRRYVPVEKKFIVYPGRELVRPKGAALLLRQRITDDGGKMRHSAETSGRRRMREHIPILQIHQNRLRKNNDLEVKVAQFHECSSREVVTRGERILKTTTTVLCTT